MKDIIFNIEVIGYSAFYIHKSINNKISSFRFSSVNQKTNKTYQYKSKIDYNEAIKIAKNEH